MANFYTVRFCLKLRGTPSTAWYLMLQSKNSLPSRIWKFFMDKVWLRMSPAGRRIVILVIISEGVGFLLLVLFLVVHYAQF